MLPYPQTPELSCIKTQRVEKQGKTRPGSVWFCEINIIVVEYMYMKIHHKATKRKPRERHVFMNSEYTTIRLHRISLPLLQQNFICPARRTTGYLKRRGFINNEYSAAQPKSKTATNTSLLIHIWPEINDTLTTENEDSKALCHTALCVCVCVRGRETI